MFFFSEQIRKWQQVSARYKENVREIQKTKIVVSIWSLIVDTITSVLHYTYPVYGSFLILLIRHSISFRDLSSNEIFSVEKGCFDQLENLESL